MKTLLKVFVGIVVSLAIIGAIFGIGVTVAYNKYAKPYTEVSLGETISVLNAIRSVPKNEEGVTSKAYDEQEELDDFLRKIKQQMFISDEVDITVEEVLTLLFPSPTSEGTEGASMSQSQKMDSFADKIEFDFSDINPEENRILSITGHNLAAVLEKALNSSDISQLKEVETKYGINIGEAINVQNIVIGKKSEKTQFSLTLEMQVREIAEAFLNKSMQGIPGFVKRFALALIPNTIYLTTEVYPDDIEEKSNFKINSMNEKNQETFNRLLSNVSAKANIEDVRTKLNKITNTSLEQLRTKGVDIQFSPSKKSVDIPALDLLLKTMGAETVTDVQFLTMLDNLQKENTLSFSPFSQSDTETFIAEELKPKLALEKWTELNGGNLFDELPNFKSHINFENFNFNEFESQRPKLSGKAFASLLNSYMHKEEARVDIALNLVAVDFSGNSEAINSTKIRIIVKLDIQDMIASKAALDPNSFKGIVLNKLVNAIFSEESFFEITMATNLTGVEGNEFDGIKADSVEFNYNGISVADTEEIFNTVNDLVFAFTNTPAMLDFSSFGSQVADVITEAFTSVGENFKKADTSDGGLYFVGENILFPNIYEIITQKIYESGEEPTAENLQKMLAELHAQERTYIDENAAQEGVDYFEPLEGGLSSPITDQKIGRMIAGKLGDLSQYHILGINQLALIPKKGAGYEAKTSALVQKIVDMSGSSETISEFEEYIVITYTVDSSYYMPESLPAGLIPRELIITNVFNIANLINAEDITNDKIYINGTSDESIASFNSLLTNFASGSMDLSLLQKAMKKKVSETTIFESPLITIGQIATLENVKVVGIDDTQDGIGKLVVEFPLP